MPDAARQAASKAFGAELLGVNLAYVFVQRRAVLKFSPLQSDADWLQHPPEYARWSLDFLQATYADPVRSSNPDIARGKLWLAPNQLSSEIVLSQLSKNRLSVCLQLDERPRPLALIALKNSASTQWRWARSDAAGCITLVGAKIEPAWNGEVFSVLDAPARFVFKAVDTPKSTIKPTLEPMLSTSSAARPQLTENAQQSYATVPIVGGCEGCALIFVQMPSKIASHARIGAQSEPGVALQLSGTVRDMQGQPRAGIVVYAHQTNVEGIYPRAVVENAQALAHGRLRAWVQSDANGHFAFTTIRPGAYPGGSEPQHIHLQVLEPNRCSYWVGDALFADDPMLSAVKRAAQENAPGGSGIDVPKWQKNQWRVRRDIVLGKDVPGYAGCGR